MHTKVNPIRRGHGAISPSKLKVTQYSVNVQRVMDQVAYRNVGCLNKASWTLQKRFVCSHHLLIVVQIIANGTNYQREYLYRIWSENTNYTDCLVDAWIAHGRFAFIDLSAGPFQYGPTISGEGVRSQYTLPTVPPKSLLQEEERFKRSYQYSDNSKRPVPSSEAQYAKYKAELELLQLLHKERCTQGPSTECTGLCPTMYCLTTRFATKDRCVARESISRSKARGSYFGWW